MRSLEEQIDHVEKEITDVGEKIVGVENKLLKTCDGEEMKYYREEKRQLRDKETQLREEKRYYREEKRQLRDKETQLKEMLQLQHMSG